MSARNKIQLIISLNLLFICNAQIIEELSAGKFPLWLDFDDVN